MEPPRRPPAGSSDRPPPGRAPRPPRAVFLDLDDTILDWGRAAEAITLACGAAASAVPGMDAVRLEQAYQETWSAYRPEAEPLCWNGGRTGFATGRETWRRSLWRCGCTDEAAVEYVFQAHLRFSRDGYRMYPDARELLSALREAGLRTALITNGPSDMQRDKLRVLGIEESFDVVVVSGEAGVAKPDPAVFAGALRALAVEPRDVWHVGDGFTNDVGGARAAGLLAVWLNRTGRALPRRGYEPDLQVPSLAHLTGLLGRARPGPALSPPRGPSSPSKTP